MHFVNFDFGCSRPNLKEFVSGLRYVLPLKQAILRKVCRCNLQLKVKVISSSGSIVTNLSVHLTRITILCILFFNRRT